MTPTEQLALLRLHLTSGIGRRSLFRLQQTFGSFSQALKLKPQDWKRLARVPAHTPCSEADPRLNQVRRRMDRLGIRLLSYWDQGFPELLRQIHDPPALLYLLGEIPPQECLAIVGSRNASTSGRQMAADLARQLAQRQVTIVSGLARGIDGCAHRGALDAGGKTLAVLGCGVDRIYPSEHARLYQQVLENGAILSELPPGTAPLSQHFPARNRIISGLSRGVLIIEAAKSSGSLITGDFALEQGRELFAVPGPVHASTSCGTNQLLKDGAQFVTEAEDILLALWPDRPTTAQRQREDSFLAELEGGTLKLYQQLDFTPRHSDELARACGLTPMEVSAILLDLELRGAAQSLPGGRYIRPTIQP